MNKLLELAFVLTPLRENVADFWQTLVMRNSTVNGLPHQWPPKMFAQWCGGPPVFLESEWRGTASLTSSCYGMGPRRSEMISSTTFNSNNTFNLKFTMSYGQLKITFFGCPLFINLKMDNFFANPLLEKQYLLQASTPKPYWSLFHMGNISGQDTTALWKSDPNIKN